MNVSGPRRRRAACALVFMLCAAGACVRTRPYATLTENADPLRTQFNNDAGHPRIVMLVAPT
ncbi:MAG TPA: hypothetical protein VH740_15365 [Vicinamibacterales bacterium]